MKTWQTSKKKSASAKIKVAQWKMFEENETHLESIPSRRLLVGNRSTRPKQADWKYTSSCILQSFIVPYGPPSHFNYPQLFQITVQIITIAAIYCSILQASGKSISTCDEFSSKAIFKLHRFSRLSLLLRFGFPTLV